MGAAPTHNVIGPDELWAYVTIRQFVMWFCELGPHPCSEVSQPIRWKAIVSPSLSQEFQET